MIMNWYSFVNQFLNITKYTLYLFHCFSNHYTVFHSVNHKNVLIAVLLTPNLKVAKIFKPIALQVYRAGLRNINRSHFLWVSQAIKHVEIAKYKRV